MSAFHFVLGCLAVWRVTHLLQAEDGPFDVVVRLRRLAGDSFVGAAMDCFYCLSVWMAAPVALALAGGWTDRLLLWPALSAGAIAVERIFEPKEHGHVVLRQQEDAAERAVEPDPDAVAGRAT